MSLEIICDGNSLMARWLGMARWLECLANSYGSIMAKKMVSREIIWLNLGFLLVESCGFNDV